MAEIRFPDPPLAGDVVRLRPWRQTDAPAIARAFADPVMQRFSWRTTEYTDADARTDLAAQEEARANGEALSLALADLSDDLLGSITLSPQTHGRADIGFWLAPVGRGRGVATQAVRLLTTWAFAELDIARLELTCAPDNEGSQRVAERCGFTREGLLRSHVPFKGGRRDSVLYSLLPQD